MTSATSNKASHLRNAWTTVGPLELNFRDQGAKISIGYRIANEALESQFSKLQTLSESVETLSRNRDPNMTKN